MSTERFPALLDGPGNHVSDPRELLLGYLDWYRRALERKTAGLSEAALRTPVDGLGWAPLGLVRHLGWVERSWVVGSARRRRRPASAGSSSTCSRSTPGTWVSSTWPASSSTGRPGSDQPGGVDTQGGKL
ncbi:DinB family protein [Micromonospora sp. NBC_00898]|nr:DinB family protein [Micromonospora sp. NBC_00898]